jgi:EAL domain-containing protein (putative c-di-GMP-specific phosphodiesterase class I)
VSNLKPEDEVEQTLKALYAAIQEEDGRWCARQGELRLSSAFQPIYSFPHARPVGFEALVRVQDAQGLPVSPISLFEGVQDFEQQIWLDRLCRLVHVHNFCAQASEDCWLFLNIHPAVFIHSTQQAMLLRRAVDLLNSLGMPMHRLVLEVTEDVMAQDQSFEDAVGWAREVGCLLALDDFGAGHSNFDRVWRLRPEIVKLDRSLLRRAMQSPRIARMMTQVVGLLHECGSLALLEGVESDEEAQLALDADIDLVQGYAFGRPQPELVPVRQTSQEITGVWRLFDERVRVSRLSYQERVAPFRTALSLALQPLQQGQELERACEAFLRQAGALMVYRLDGEGRAVGDIAYSEAGRPQPIERFAPLERAGDARWARRPYFRRAVDQVGEIQVTRPYLSLFGARLCITVSVAYWLQGQLQVLCGDVDWSDRDAL